MVDGFHSESKQNKLFLMIYQYTVSFATKKQREKLHIVLYHIVSVLFVQMNSNS